MEYTKGEWLIDRPKYDKEAIIIHARQQNPEPNVLWRSIPIAELLRTDENEANAHLIAAAPKLYEALVALSGITHDLTQGNGKPDSVIETANKMARQALASAEGREE